MKQNRSQTDSFIVRNQRIWYWKTMSGTFFLLTCLCIVAYQWKIGIVALGGCLALWLAGRNIDCPSRGVWIQVRGDDLTLYRGKIPVNRVSKDQIVAMKVCPISTRFGQTGGHITLYGEGMQELITLNANADNIDLLIDLVGREKMA